MILFVGKPEKAGGWMEEVAKKHGWETAYVPASFQIQSQVDQILSYPTCKVILYDIEQYSQPAEEIAEIIHRIEQANRAKAVIFASGYNPRSTMIMELLYHGIQYFIYGAYLADKKEELERCIQGKTESEYVLDDTEPVEVDEVTPGGTSCRTIGIAGAIPRMGTTTQAIQFVKYLMFSGHKACYIEMNSHGWVEALVEAYADVSVDREMGRVTYQNVDLFYRPEKLPDVLKLDYDFYVYDYGVYNDQDFNKISFLEKDLQIFVVGTKPGEFLRTYHLIESNFYRNVVYIFNFVRDDAEEHEDIYDLMQEKRDMTYFAADCRDPFLYTNAEIYSQILPVEPDSQSQEPKHKRHKSFWRRKKR